MQIITKTFWLLLGLLFVAGVGAEEETMEQKRTRLKTEQRIAAPKIKVDKTRVRQREEARQKERDRIAREQAEQAAEAARQRAERERAAVGIDMVRIPAGSFTMGCQDGRDQDCRDHEKPAHKVQLAAFELGKTEVTVGQFRAFIEATNYQTTAEKQGSCYSLDSSGNWGYVKGNSWRKLGFSQTDNDPVACVSWDDSQAMIGWLNKTAGGGYRLPSESEWEYAARAGSNSNFIWGNDPDQACRYANVADQTAKSKAGRSGWTIFNCADGYTDTAPVGKFLPNAFGLYDMSGNVWEWVQDSYHSDYNGAPSDGRAWEGARAVARVLRGGSWDYYPQYVRAAFRVNGTATNRINNIGFRLARTLP